jgi:hypothetical protein
VTVDQSILDRLEQARGALGDAQRALQRTGNALTIANGLVKAAPPGAAAGAVLDRIARLRGELEAAALDQALDRFEADVQELLRAAKGDE